MNIDNDRLKTYIDNIDSALRSALTLSQQLQSEIQTTEGDTDLFRKLAMYLTPNMNHWIDGLQAGNVRDLRLVLEQRTPRIEQPKEKKKKKSKK